MHITLHTVMQKPPFRRSVAALATTAALLSVTAACSSDDSDADSGSNSDNGGGATAATSGAGIDATASAPLTFELAESTLGDRFAELKVCAIGQWDENSTGVDEDYRDQVSFFRQYDCYRDSGQVSTGFPERVQQVNYVEFADATTARAYAEDQAILYRTIIDDQAVVVFGTGLEQASMDAYADDLIAACGCEEVTG